jgi:hypothetical protein
MQYSSFAYFCFLQFYVKWGVVQYFSKIRFLFMWLAKINMIQGRIQDFKLGGGALKKIAPREGRREHFWGISCEKSRFYASSTALWHSVV